MMAEKYEKQLKNSGTSKPLTKLIIEKKDKEKEISTTSNNENSNSTESSKKVKILGDEAEYDIKSL